MLLELTTVNILGKQSRVGILTIFVDLYDTFRLVRMFDLGPE